MIALTYSNTHFLTLIDKEEAESQREYKSVNLKYITMGRLDDDMIVPPSDGAMFILID